jgi:hypothetical protein
MATLFAGTIISEVGFTALLGTASALTSTSSGVYKLLYGIMRYSGPNKTNIITTIFELDIENTIRIIESLLREIPKDKINSLPVLQAIDSLHDMIKTISNELKIIYERLKYNESLWMGTYWRAYDCTNNLKRLKTYSEILDKRKKIFFEVLQVQKELLTNISSQNMSSVTNNLIFNKIECKSDSLKYIEQIKNDSGIPLIKEKEEYVNLLLDDGIKKINSELVIKEDYK